MSMMAVENTAQEAAVAPHFQGINLPSFAVEILLSALVYRFVFEGRAVSIFRRWILGSRIGQTSAVTREGTVLRSLLEEASFAFALSIHHFIAASLMLMGYLSNSPQTWLRGVAFEMGYELIDTLALINNAWPYSVLKQPLLKLIPLFHHVPTLLLVPFLLRLGYQHDKDMQVLGWSLIGAGAVALCSEGLKKTLSMEDNPGTWLAIHILNTIVVFSFRLVVFTFTALRAAKTVQGDPRARHVFPFFLLGIVSIMMFNVFIMLTYVWKLVRSLHEMAIAKAFRLISMPQKLYEGPKQT